MPLLGSIATAADVYVSPAGNDANPGTRNQPVATLVRARDLTRPMAGKQPVTVHVADGVYFLPATLVFSPADSGTANAPIVYRADHEGGAILSGGSKLTLNWTPYKHGILQAATPVGLEIDQLFIDGQNQRMARYPNYDPSKKSEPYQGFSADAFSKVRAANWANPAGGYIHAIHRASWGGYHYRITGKDPQGEVTYEGGWQNNRQMGMHKDFRMVENIFEELDAPGEWFHNAKTGTLYYQPAAGVDLNKAIVEVVRLRHLVEFQGAETSPVKFITLQGFVIRHATRTFMDTKEQLLRSDWAIYRGGAVMLTGTEDVQILDTQFDQVGGNAIFVNNYNRRTLVKGCHIHDTGASGVCFVGDPHAVRDPLFQYSQKNDLATIDRTVGPKTSNFPSHGAVEDCLIHDIGRVERQPAGVQIEMAMEISVRDCSIYDCARAGINIGDGAWGGHLIERCDVFDTVLETHDHGSFNSWGRDRYWRSDQPASQAAVDAEPKLPFLDAMKTTTIRDSRWRCDHGWDIDLDDGSSNYDLYNNLLLGKGLKFREGFRRHAWNNVIPFGSFHPHVWYDNSKDQVSGNIFSTPHRPARMSKPYIDETSVDRNFFNMSDRSALDASAVLGWDTNSLFGDPQFVDPAQGDFRVNDGSPVFALGFKNFPMDQFGVKKASLKAVAQTPIIPTATEPMRDASELWKQTSATPVVADSFDRYWLGAKLLELSGEDFSAYGTRQEDGGVALPAVPAGSAAALAGLKVGDLVQAVNGQPTKTVADLLSVLEKTGDAPLTLKLVRNQAVSELTFTPATYVLTEAAATDEFSKLKVPAANDSRVTANQKTNNQPLDSLTDGKLSADYGPVFGNGIKNGAYKMDLGAALPVAAITSWSYKQNENRGAHNITLYGSNSPTDPGWHLNKFTPLGTIDTTRDEAANYNAASLRATARNSLGTFRWIVWRVAPVSSAGGGENTAFQELAVEITSYENTNHHVAVPEKKNDYSAQRWESKRLKPNVIVIYTDDQGYGDVSALNPEAKFQTPNLDRLANEGIAFTNGHSSDSVCTPSRYGLLTGRYSWRTAMKKGVMGAEGKCLITDERMTLASLFKQQGYHTAMVGKWHLGMDFPGTPQTRDWSQPIQDMPLDKGFDYFYGVPASLNYGVLAWFEGRHAAVPPTLYTNKKKNPRHMDYRIMPPYETGPGPSKDPTRTIKKGFEVAEDFIDNQCLTRFTDKAIEWMDGKTAEAKKGQPFFLYLPYTSPHYPVCPLPEFHGKGAAGAYGEFVIETDYHVGRILAFLKNAGLDENTLIVFTSDNGPENSWSGRIKEFGHDSRGGNREGKRSVYEGGHRVPFLVRWPAGISEPGRSWDKVVGQTDLLATFAELLNVALPTHAGEDSQSFAAVLVNPKHDYDRAPLITHANGGNEFRYGITEGDWKLVLPDAKHSAELYDLKSDRAEANNVSVQHPELTHRLTKLITKIVAQGRTTSGGASPNDTGYWKDLTWMTEAEYKSAQ